MKKKIGMLVAIFVLTCSTHAYANPTVDIKYLYVEQDGMWSVDLEDSYRDCEHENECTEHLFYGVSCRNIDGMTARGVTGTPLSNWNWRYYNDSAGGWSSDCDVERYYGIYRNVWATYCTEQYNLNNESIDPWAARLSYKIDPSETSWRRAYALCFTNV